MHTPRQLLPFTLLLAVGAAIPGACSPHQATASASRAASAATPDPYPGVNSVAEDRDVWQQLLSDHAAIRRTVTYTPNGVEATTESDDPAVAARITTHARAMQARIKTGARVRVWDPVFAALFEKHGAVRLEISPTDRGVTIAESSDDPEAVVLLWSHAAGVSDFVREGHDAGGRATPLVKVGAPPPPPELAIGGVKHRFLLSQPDATALSGLHTQGVTTVVNFRHAKEHATYDEKAAATGAGLGYCNLPYMGAAELTDEVIDAARATMREIDTKGETAALHCRTGNRVGPGWAAYRALDVGLPAEQALAEAKALRMNDPLMESKTRDYIRRHAPAAKAAGGWSPLEPGAMTPTQQSQQQQALAARDAMFSRLMTALTAAMTREGPDVCTAGAIGTCKEEAPKIAQAVAREKGVMIGRTSAKLRNQANLAPAWAGPLIAQPAEGFPTPRFAVNGDGSFAAVLPIKLGAACLACHGDPAQMEPAVKTSLAEKYPKDQATGFKEGDLRGWFWVEVPAR